ncbi:MAG: lactate utilization protein [Syntrophobacteraceae bacterium]
MEKPIENFWSLRLADLKDALEANNFEVHIAENVDAAKKIVRELLPRIGAKSMSWGGSMTYVQTGLYQELKDYPGIEVLDAYEKGLPPEEMLERRRRSLLVDLFITGTNAVTETGKLVNLDMLGNRVAGITFGPRNVIILAGRNKVVCVKTSICEECRSLDRICNTWTITEKSFPKGRIKIVLINEDLGL